MRTFIRNMNVLHPYIGPEKAPMRAGLKSKAVVSIALSQPRFVQNHTGHFAPNRSARAV